MVVNGSSNARGRDSSERRAISPLQAADRRVKATCMATLPPFYRLPFKPNAKKLPGVRFPDGKLHLRVFYGLWHSDGTRCLKWVRLLGF